MRHWLLTNTTYGTWLPGDRRGSITSVRDFRRGDPVRTTRFEHALPGEACEPSLPGLYRSATANLKCAPVLQNRQQALVLLAQFQETCEFRGWDLLAAAIMANHFHLVIAVPGDPDPRRMLVDLKAYGTRTLNAEFGRRDNRTWWTSAGSKRKLADAAAVQAAINYVLLKQPNPLVVWSPP